MCYLKQDSCADEIKYDVDKANVAALQLRLDAISKNHGDSYVDGVQPAFNVLEARHFVILTRRGTGFRQDVLFMFNDIIFDRPTTVDRVITARCIQIMNCAGARHLRAVLH
jgi:fatty acid synthase subunit alpha